MAVFQWARRLSRLWLSATVVRESGCQDFAAALYNVGVPYGTGEGAPQNDVLTYMWYTLAMIHSTGHSISKVQKNAAENRKVVARRMTPAQIAEVQRLAREWKPKSK